MSKTKAMFDQLLMHLHDTAAEEYGDEEGRKYLLRLLEDATEQYDSISESERSVSLRQIYQWVEPKKREHGTLLRIYQALAPGFERKR